MKKVALALAAAALTLSAGSALAQKKQLVIVVKGLDNPFFEAIHQGCEKWNKENASSPYECFYTGPASTSDEAGEAQIVSDMLGKSDTAAIAISPSNAPLIAKTHQVRQSDDPDHDDRRRPHEGRFGAAQDLSRHRQLPDGLQARRVPEEGQAERRHDLHHRRQRRRRQHPAPRARARATRLSGKKGLDRLNGEGGWTEVAGCPVFTNDDGAKGVQAMTDILAANPKLDAFVIKGGWPLFGAPQPYAICPTSSRTRSPTSDSSSSPPTRSATKWRSPRKGLVDRAGRPASVRDGLQGAVGHDRPDRGQEGRRSGVHRPRRMHQGHGRHLHPEVESAAPRSFRARPGGGAKAPPHRWLWQEKATYCNSGVNARGRQAMFPNRGVEGLPSVGEHQESVENQDIAENVKRR